jgi:ABC-2 type transport system permease protein
VGHAVNNAIIARRLSDRGIHVDDAKELLSGVDLSLVRVTKSGESEEKGEGFLVQISVGMILYITLMVYGMMTMRSVLEEKTTRIVEVLASSIKPSHLLAGKIVGVAAVGFTQYLIWGVTAGLISTYGAAVGAAFRPGSTGLGFHLPLSFVVYPFIFFLAGYFLYASLYAALGAMASSEEDLQQIQLPVTLILVACFMLYPIIMHDPNSWVSVGLTLFPLFSPILMVFRIMVQPPPFWQIALSVGLCVASTVGVVRISARIYRVGILMYGKRPSVVELIKWVKYT